MKKDCPTLREQWRTASAGGVKAVYEIVIDGVDEKSVAAAMGAGIKAAVHVPVRTILAVTLLATRPLQKLSSSNVI